MMRFADDDDDDGGGDDAPRERRPDAPAASHGGNFARRRSSAFSMHFDSSSDGGDDGSAATPEEQPSPKLQFTRRRSVADQQQLAGLQSAAQRVRLPEQPAEGLASMSEKDGGRLAAQPSVVELTMPSGAFFRPAGLGDSAEHEARVSAAFFGPARIGDDDGDDDGYGGAAHLGVEPARAEPAFYTPMASDGTASDAAEDAPQACMAPPSPVAGFTRRRSIADQEEMLAGRRRSSVAAAPDVAEPREQEQSASAFATPRRRRSSVRAAAAAAGPREREASASVFGAPQPSLAAEPTHPSGAFFFPAGFGGSGEQERGARAAPGVAVEPPARAAVARSGTSPRPMMIRRRKSAVSILGVVADNDEVSPHPPSQPPSQPASRPPSPIQNFTRRRSLAEQELVADRSASVAVAPLARPLHRGVPDGMTSVNSHDDDPIDFVKSAACSRPPSPLEAGFLTTPARPSGAALSRSPSAVSQAFFTPCGSRAPSVAPSHATDRAFATPRRGEYDMTEDGPLNGDDSEAWKTFDQSTGDGSDEGGQRRALDDDDDDDDDMLMEDL
jgi:hypothetical protein